MRQIDRLRAEALGRLLPWLDLGPSVAIQSRVSLRHTSGNIRIGAGSNIEVASVLHAWNGRIDLVRDVQVGPGCILYGQGGITVGYRTLLSPRVTIIASNHGLAPGTAIREQPTTDIGVTIGEHCWIGANASILDGVTIGDGAVVGAGAVVAKDVPANAIVVGVPARVVRHR